MRLRVAAPAVLTQELLLPILLLRAEAASRWTPCGGVAGGLLGSWHWSGAEVWERGERACRHIWPGLQDMGDSRPMIT